MPLSIKAANYVLGHNRIDIARDYPEFSSVIRKTGINQVHESNCNSRELARQCLDDFLSRFPELKPKVDCLIVVTQSPVNFLPNMACVLQHDCQLPQSVLAFDINQGCSGFVQALLVADGLLKSHENILIVCVDTYRAKLRSSDRSTSAVFSDAASAVWISSDPEFEILSASHYADGSGERLLKQSIPSTGQSEYLTMSGADVFLFTKNVVPRLIEDLLRSSEMVTSDVDDWFLHQASKLVLDAIRTELTIQSGLHSSLAETGNTVSSSIPILLSNRIGQLGENVLMCGFGVGLSCTALILRRI